MNNHSNEEPKTKLFEVFPLELQKVVVDKYIKDSKEKHSKDKGKDKDKSFKKVLGSNSKIKKTIKKEVKEYAFNKSKKLPLDTKNQVLSAIKFFWKVKNVDQYEKEEGFHKIVKKCEIFSICTMGFKKDCENNKLFRQFNDSTELEAN